MISKYALERTKWSKIRGKSECNGMELKLFLDEQVMDLHEFTRVFVNT